MSMNRSDLIRFVLKKAGATRLTLAQIAELNGWDQIEKNAATTNLGQMRKRGEISVELVEGRAAYALVPGWRPGQAPELERANGESGDGVGEGVMLAPPARLPGALTVAPGGELTSEIQVARLRKLQADLERQILEVLDDAAARALFSAFLEVSRILGGVSPP